MKRRSLKLGVLAAASIWHLWLARPSLSIVEVLFGVTPYVLLVLAWDFIDRIWLIVPTLAVVAWSDVTVFLAVREAVRVSSTAGVAIGFQFLFACGVVGAATLIAWFLPERSKRRHRRRV